MTGIRAARPEDEAALYEICLRTGATGEDASGLYDDGDLLGHVFVGPYLRLEPDFAFVLTDDEGLAGYVLGTPDTRAFERACEADWWPALRRRYPLEAYTDQDRDLRLVRLIHDLPETPEDVATTYPAHLHIDLLPRAQGQGHGRRLMLALFDQLIAAGVAGVHLGVGNSNERAMGFYRRLGFTDIGPLGVDGRVMARGL